MPWWTPKEPAPYDVWAAARARHTQAIMNHGRDSDEAKAAEKIADEAFAALDIEGALCKDDPSAST